MNDELLQKDLAVAKKLYDKIKESKENFLELLDTLLDLITFIPVCADEYGNNEFALFDFKNLILDDICAVLRDYDFKLVKII